MTAPLVGRDGELALFRRAIEERVRTVSVSGPAGVGKSVLVRAGLIGTSHALCVIEDASLALLEHVAIALDVPLLVEDEARREARVLSALAARAPFALVLDGVSLEGSALLPVLERWASATGDDVTFVVTSQRRLPLARELALAPLATAPTGASLADAQALPAVALFVEHARRRSGFALDEENVSDVVAIVQALDGLPLALLLAAARVGILGARRTRELLEQRFELLVSREETLPRHRSLEAALAWSWDLLTETEQHDLTALVTFREGFTLAAADAVLGAGGELSALARVEALLDTSMVQLVVTATSSVAARFALYESVRSYASVRHDGAALREATARHAAYFVDAAEAQAERVAKSGDLAARRWLSAEAANVRAVAQGAASAADRLRAALALESIFLARGPLEEHTKLVEANLKELGNADSHDRLRLRARFSLGLTDIFRGRRVEAGHALRAVHADAQTLGHFDLAARAASKAGLVLGLMGDAAAEPLFAAAAAHLTRHRSASTEPCDSLVGMLAKDRGMVLSEQGENAEAIAAFGEALEAFRAAGDLREQGFVLAAIAARHLDAGSLATARNVAARALHDLEEAGDRRTLAWTRHLLAIVALEEGEHATATEHAAAARALARGVGDAWTEGMITGVLGHIALDTGESAAADARYREAEPLLLRAEDGRSLGIVKAAWAVALDRLGETLEATRRLAEARELTSARGRPGDQEAVALFGAVLELARAGHLHARGDAQAARAMLDDVQRLVLRIADPAGGVFRSDEVRFAERLAKRQLDATLGRLGPAAAGPSELVVAPDGHWFRLPSGEKTTIRGRPVAGRLLLLLAKHAVTEPGKPVLAAELIAAGWPGEKIMPAAAQNRLYVAMARLRQLGLNELIRNEGDGYFVAATTRVRWAELGET